MTTTIEPTDVDVPLDDGPPVDPWEHATPAATPEPTNDVPLVRPAVAAMVAELDAHYKGADCPSIDKTATAMKDVTAKPESWGSRGQVADAVKAYREKHNIPAARPAPKRATRTKPPKPRRTAAVRPEPTAPVPPVVRAEPAPVVQQPVPSPPPVVQPTVRTAPDRTVRSWPVMVIALPAMVAIWGGWVGLGGLTGFGDINLLPGIVADNGWATIDSAITLPIGVEAYAAFALRVWLSGHVPAKAKVFARWSAIGSLVVGALGQVAYHLLEAAGVQSAPWQITTLVACLPVAVLGMAAALVHLMREEG